MNLVVVTDLDGTLLDHSSYSFDAARPALAALRERKIPLVLATSKTAAEVAPLHRTLQLGTTPAIVENGAGVIVPDSAGAKDSSNRAYGQIRSSLDNVPRDLRNLFAGFGDVDAAEVSNWTGLSHDAAHQAKDRQYSEPGLWNGTDADRERFQNVLLEQGVYSRFGGRFLTLSLGRTKADAMSEVAADLKAQVVVALGDAPNDTEMLEAADIGVVVRNDGGVPLPPLKGEADGRIRRTFETGPIGWNLTVLQILSDLNQTQGAT